MLLPKQGRNRLLQAIHNFFLQNQVKITPPEIVDLLKQMIPELQHILVDSDQPNAVDKALLRQAFQSISENPAIQVVYLMTGDQDYRNFLHILEAKGIDTIIVCRSSGYAKQIANNSQPMRYINALIKYPERWWYPPDHTASVDSIKLVSHKVDLLGEKLIEHRLDDKLIQNLIEYMNSDIILIREKVLGFLWKLCLKYNGSRQHRHLIHLLQAHIPMWLEREQEKQVQKLVDLIQRIEDSYRASR